MQQILNGTEALASALEKVACHRYMLVCDGAFPYLPIKEFFNTDVVFNQFGSNPLYEDVVKGVEMFNANHCDALVAVGGGSTIDVAKCIKLFCRMNPAENYFAQDFADSGVPLVAIPTTAGTGSESTRYAVVYYRGEKQSITHGSLIPDYAILDSSLLATLPLYQKKCTMLDALCQGIESLWSVNSTAESMSYAKLAIEGIMYNWRAYIEHNDATAARHIMTAANHAGQAINISQTTAPHAMSYKLSSLYGVPHGHAVALCLPEVWLYMLENADNTIDPRGQQHLEEVFEQLGQLMMCDSPHQGPMMFRSIMSQFDLPKVKCVDFESELDTLVHSVNPVRLKNNPVPLDENIFAHIYKNILQ